MSRIGKLPISIPAGVTVTQANDMVTVKGPKGEMSQHVDPSIKVNVADGQIVFEVDENSPVNIKQKQAFHGLYRSLINNMVVGVSEGYTKVLELVGVGYRVSTQGNLIEFSLGYTTSSCWVSSALKFVLSASPSLIRVKVFCSRVRLFAGSLVRPPQLSNFKFRRL